MTIAQPNATSPLRTAIDDVAAHCSVIARAQSMCEVEVESVLSHPQVARGELSTALEECDVATVDNVSISGLVAGSAIRPLDDLLTRFGADLPDHMRVEVDGQIMAIAFMADAQVLACRADVLQQVGMERPQTYDALLATANAIRQAGIMTHPIGGAYAAGLPRALAFCDLYLGAGGAFDGGSGIDRACGREALEMMEKLAEYMAPETLGHDAAAACSAWNTGQVALMGVHAARVPALTGDPVVGALPLMGIRDLPSAALWWNGWAISAHLSEDEAAEAFQTMAKATSPSLLSAETMPQALWLMDGFTPGPAHQGVLATVAAGAVPFPISIGQYQLLGTLGTGLTGFLEGEKTVSDVLAEIPSG